MKMVKIVDFKHFGKETLGGRERYREILEV